jgi:hypothetical protein
MRPVAIKTLSLYTLLSLVLQSRLGSQGARQQANSGSQVNSGSQAVRTRGKTSSIDQYFGKMSGVGKRSSAEDD